MSTTKTALPSKGACRDVWAKRRRQEQALSTAVERVTAMQAIYSAAVRSQARQMWAEYEGQA